MTEGRLSKKTKIYIIAAIVIWYLVDKGAWLYHQMNPSVSSLDRILGVFNYYSKALENPLPSLMLEDIKIGLEYTLQRTLILRNLGKERSMVLLDGEGKRTLSHILIMKMMITTFF